MVQWINILRDNNFVNYLYCVERHSGAMHLVQQGLADRQVGGQVDKIRNSL